jgi:hypothetical protein
MFAKNSMKSQGPKKGQYQQGYFVPQDLKKYVGDPTRIIYRSSWELKFMQFLDRSPSILKWSNESFAIPYFSPLDKRGHRYFIDFLVVTKDSEGNQQTWIIEVKPSKYFTKPEAPKRMTDQSTKNYLYSAKQYIINMAKFEAAKQFCAERGLKFGIVTENFIFRGI